MNRALALLTLITPLWLAGCSSQSAPRPEPYSNDEVKSFALKILGSSNMSDELYAKYRRALTEPREDGRSGS
ncbi:hypothetical protein ACYCAX_14375 [Pseudomonas sp. MT3]|uniref:hypothetical protein n=1 Tax=Pseudomonas sp. ATCC 13867 TaxID=1294143 RepID=UPI0002C4F064|nr:hypothetical protein [Pseudomonas sp. ATCC 13867]AGI25166.1 lipoprotein [Pseudomonas sp. ATCC 13867]RFQ34951.1 hypothetical protein D0N87_09975 [Pseudomonas sp. ATCC 13867]